MGKRLYRKELTPDKGQDSGEHRIARERIRQAMLKIKRSFPVLIDAVDYMEPLPVQEEISGICTDGRHLFYNAGNIASYRGEDFELFRKILHIIFHGLLGHFEKPTDFEKIRLHWDVMDIQVFELFGEVGISYDGKILCGGMGSLYTEAEELFRDEMGNSLYYRALNDEGLQRKIKSLTKRIKGMYSKDLDDHSTWALPLLELKVSPKNSPSSGAGDEKEKQEESRKNQSGTQDEWRELTVTVLGGVSFPQGKETSRELINAIARAIREAGIRNWGTAAGGMQGEEVRAKEEGVMAYHELLNEASSFAVVNAQEDEIDPVLYEYGLDLYGDVPLIEPVEEKFKVQLNSVIIAVDTSGSCMDYLEKFWSETVEIFRELEETGGIETLHYLECDAQIQYEETYDSVDELSAGEKGLHRFSGYGGTSFIPVFQKAEEYEKQGEKVDLLIFFTDGEGDYPTWETDFSTYFVFPEKEYLKYTKDYRPKWINTMVLDHKL